MAATSWRRSMAPLLERRVGPRKSRSSATSRPRRSGIRCWPSERRSVARRVRAQRGATPPLPANDADIAYAPVTQLSRWVERKALTSERLTNIYLRASRSSIRSCGRSSRSRRISRSRRRTTGRRGDRGGQISRAAARHSLRREGSARHGRHRDDLRRRAVPRSRAGRRRAVVHRLHEAGAVLIAKLSLGALALNDIWFGGQTMNPWLLEEGASGRAPGPGAATAAGSSASRSAARRAAASRAGHALRRDRTAADVRPRAAHRRHDALLVARQARPDDAQRRGRDAGAAGDHGPDAGDLSSVPSRLDFDADGTGRRAARRLLPGLDEREPGDRRRPRCARDGGSSAWPPWK